MQLQKPQVGVTFVFGFVTIARTVFLALSLIAVFPSYVRSQSSPAWSSQAAELNETMTDLISVAGLAFLKRLKTIPNPISLALELED